MDLRGAVKEALGAALGGGAGAADAFAVERLGTRTTVRKGALETAHESATRGVGVRAFRDGRMGMACTTDLTEEGLRGAGARAADIARMAGEDTAAGLPAAEHRGVLAPPEGLDDPGFDSFDPAAGVEMARASEAAAFSLDARITNSQGATFHSSRSLVALASSDGFEGSFRRTRFGLSVVVAAAEGGGVNQRAHWWTASPRLGGLDDPEEVGREAARRCLRRLGWRKIPTCRVPVVFAPEAAAELAAHVADACKGSALFRGASFLADSLGKEVASPLLTLVDDPTLPGRLGTVAFDGEGVLPRRKAILEGGVLRSFLFDSYSLRRLAAEAPGRAAGGAPGNAGRGISGSTIVGTSNLF
ncbi:MAG: TldD/PmbA family protein, partial [Planctomycetes bacterium]|nr:TldD/PmbA family protein [Planctomycetota bacterium]